MKTYRIKEMFGPTLQGEGSNAGLPVKFLRFAGCNKWNGLAKTKPVAICSFCDTDFVGGDRLSYKEIIDKLNDLGPVKTVVISGGEPTIQLDKELLNELRLAGYTIHLETNGSNALGELHSLIDHITCSPKQSADETKLEACHDLKILHPFISDKITIDGFKDFKTEKKYLQPIDCDEYQENLESTIARLYRHPDWKLSLQQHKILGVE